MASLRAAFVIEQTLGHVTHYRNLRDVVAGQPQVTPTWLPIPFEVRGPERLVPLLRNNWSVRASWRARSALNSALARDALDALFFHTQVTALFSRSIMQRVPTVISLDATPINYDSVGAYYNHRPSGDGFIDRRKQEMNRQTFEAATALVAWSEWAKRSLVNDYGVQDHRVRVIAPGAASLYFELGQRRSARPVSEQRERVRLLFVGGDFARKGGQLLLEAMRDGLGERCALDVVTSERLPSVPNVQVHNGVTPNSPKLKQLFADADVFVLPTLADCLPLVLMEAAAAGLPVVASSVGAVTEALVPGESGLLVPASSVAALKSALTALAEDEQLRQRMGRAAHHFARRKFDARRNNQDVLKLIADVAHSGTTRKVA